MFAGTGIGMIFVANSWDGIVDTLDGTKAVA